jgi:asparagine N-glycosylation enzyme membrane subunit Stt3
MNIVYVQNNIYTHSIGWTTQLVHLVNRMKWLKKNSSNNEQISIAESQPEPEHPSVDNPDEKYAPELETLEQPEIEPIQTSSKPDEAYNEPVSPSKISGRRRDRTSQAENAMEKKNRFSYFNALKRSWVGQHWKTLAILMAIFCLGFFARGYYGLQPATEDGFVLSGGSDSYYHNYVISYADESGQHHFWDNMLNYPLGTRNPRPPLYDWSVTLMGIGLSPFFDGDVFTSTMYMLLFSTAFWGALTIFPTYFLGKEAFGKKAGIIAALLLAIMPGHIQRSVLTNADHDAITLFFIVTAFFFFLKALKVMEKKEWISTWKPKVVYAGTKSFIVSNKVSILYSVLAGFSIAGVALIWQGFAYVIVLVSVYFLFQIIVNRFRNVDSLGVTILYFITVGTGLLVAFPYYYQSIQIASWFDTPSILFLGLFAFGIFLILTRKFPWFLVFSSMILLSVLTVFILKVFAPSILDTIVNALLSGGGYFINNKQYQTIAEAQAPPFSNLALSFGIFTFWLSFVGLAWAAIQLPKSWAPDLTLMLLWSGSAIYMAVTAARFMFNAGPAFAITGGWIIAIIIGKIDFKKYTDGLRRTSRPNMTYAFKLGLLASLTIVILMSLVLSSISNTAYPVFVIGISAICGIYTLNLIAETNPNRIYNLLTVMIPASGVLFYILAEFYTTWVISDATHLFILAILLFSYFALYMQVRKTSFMFTFGIIFLTFCIIVPNVWAGLDAGIPYETKSDYDKEIYNSMPLFLQPTDYDVKNGTNWYLGGFGYSLPLNSRYWPAAYDWLATQDTDIYPAYERPAFISWWDYGFEIVNEGQHPTVADNFLGGHQLAGNFIMAQSEADAIALLITRILEGNWLGSSIGDVQGHFDSGVITLLNQYGLNSVELQHIFTTPSDYIKEIQAHPDKYGPRDDVIQPQNAKYIASRVLFTETLDEENIVNFYNDLCTLTGDSIRYFGIDSRLFPFSADSTGIFYAPAKLSDHRIDDVANQPYDFWEIKAVGEFGGEYALDEIPPDVNLNPDTPYKIVYKDMFYNSMLYKAFIGYSGSDIGSEEGIPGLTESLSSNPIMPGWNMTHFKLEYRTAYWNPYSAKDIQNHTDAWKAMNYWDAYNKQQAGDGISDLSDRSSLYQGVMMLKYYHGAIISGKVTLEDGTPIEGVSVTVSDDFDIPHQKVTTDRNGSYSIIAPYGNITLTVSKGTIDPMTLRGTELNVTKMYIEDYQAMRANEDRDNNGKPDYLINRNLIISSGGVSGYAFWDLNADGTLGSTEEIIPYAKITLINNESAYKTSMIADNSGNYLFQKLPPGGYSVQVSTANRTVGTLQLTVTSNQVSENNLPIPVTPVSGSVSFSDGTPASDTTVSFWMPEENLEVAAMTDSNGTYSISNILIGNFTAQAYIYEQYASTIQRVQINPSINNTVNFVLYDSLRLNGTVYLNGVPVPFVTIKFAGPSSSIVTTNASGQYSIVLNDGDYTYYINHIKNGGTYAVLDVIYIDEDQTLDIVLNPACMVNGKVIDYNGGEASFTQVVFDSIDSSIYISAKTDIFGDYSIIVPQGNYLVQISSELSGSYYALHGLLSKSITLNIVTKEGTSVSGTIFWDMVSNGAVDDNEGLENARITFQDASGISAQAITNETGAFSIVLPPTTPFTITISKIGFYSVLLGTYTPTDLKKELIQSLEPILIPITGALYLGDKVLTDQNIIVKFTGNYKLQPSAEFQVGHDGMYSGMLLPGMYTISFTHNLTTGNDSIVYQIDEDLSMDTGFYIGKTLYMDLFAVQRAKVTLSLKNSLEGWGNVSFRYGPEDRYFNMENSTQSFYVMSGDYLLSASYSSNETFFVDMQDVSVFNTSNNYTISFKEGATVTGSLLYNGNNVTQQKVTFNDTKTNATISVYTDDMGVFNAILLPNVRYEISVDFIAYDDTPYLRAYRYYSRGTIVDTTVSLPHQRINLIRENYTINLEGLVNRSGRPAPDTELTFISEFGNFTATTNTTGTFSLSLPPAQYLLYAYQPSSHFVYLAKVLIEIDQTRFSIDLISGNRIYGTAYYDLNKNLITAIHFATEDGTNISTSSNNKGYYEFWLPSGNYNIVSEITTLKNEIDVTYSLNMDVNLQADRQINLPLSMVEQRIVFVSYNPSQLKEISDNATVLYNFEVENTGNIRDTYVITASGGTPDWTTELSKSEITLDPGVNNKATMSVKVGIPAYARIDQNKITITATSKKDGTITHNTVMNVLIHQYNKLSIQPTAKSPKFIQGNITGEFSILNTGNGADKFTFYIANNADLILNGWTAKLGTLQGSEMKNDGKMIVNVSAASAASSTISIILSPTKINPSRQVSVLIVGYSQIDESAISSNYIVLKYPVLELSSTNVTITGNHVSETVSGDQLTNTGVMVISVASALIIFYYARKKRWIR